MGGILSERVETQGLSVFLRSITLFPPFVFCSSLFFVWREDTPWAPAPPHHPHPYFPQSHSRAPPSVSKRYLTRPLLITFHLLLHFRHHGEYPNLRLASTYTAHHNSYLITYWLVETFFVKAERAVLERITVHSKLVEQSLYRMLVSSQRFHVPFSCLLLCLDTCCLSPTTPLLCTSLSLSLRVIVCFSAIDRLALPSIVGWRFSHPGSTLLFQHHPDCTTHHHLVVIL